MTQNEFDDAVSRLTQKGVKGIGDDATCRLFTVLHPILRDRRERHGINLPNDWCASKKEIAALLHKNAANGRLQRLKEVAEAVEVETIPVTPTTSTRQ
jgi:hypothetical protein